MKLIIDENKKFFLTVGIGLGVLLLVLGYDSSKRQAAAEMRETNQALEEELEDTVDKFLRHEGIARRTNQVLKKEFLPRIKNKLEFSDSLPPAPRDLEPAVHLRQELARMLREVKSSALRKNISVPANWDIGEKIKAKNTPQEVAELRLRLSATSALVRKCIENNVKRIRKIEHRKPGIEVIEETTAVVRRLPFVIDFEAQLPSVAGVILSFAGTHEGEGGFIEIQRCSISGSSGRGTLIAKIELAVLRILDRSEVKEQVGEPLPAAKRPARTPGQRRPGRRRY